MTVAYAYFRYIIDREKHKSLANYYPGATDVPLIVAAQARVLDDMENKATDKAPKEGIISSNQEKNTTLMMAVKTESKCGLCFRILYGLLCILAAMTAFTVIAVAILTSIVTKAYDTEQSSRLVGMVMLAVTAAVTVSVSVYGLVAVIKNHSKPIHATGIVLLVVVIIQAVICGVFVNVSPTDEANLGKSLTDSFKLSMDSNPRHVRLWALTQNDLHCCGILGPDDYRQKNVPYYFAPNVPIACCPAYEKNRSELVQEREREYCKAKKTYYHIGCKLLVINAFKESAAIVLTVSVTLIIFEVILVVLGCCISKQKKRRKENEDQGKNSKVVGSE